MLKSYDYIEYSEDNTSIQDTGFFNKELEIAHSFINKGVKPTKQGSIPSCLCEGEMLPFFEKWGIPYYRCNNCGCVTAAVEEEEVEAFNKETDLNDYRRSVQYQKNAEEKRELSWEELIDWIRFRTYRYLGEKRASIIDCGNRYEGLVQKIKKSPFCKEYRLMNSILCEEEGGQGSAFKGDVLLHLNNLQRSINPVKDLETVGRELRNGGLLFLSTRIGTGFDTLCLREHSKVFPYEHIYLPSIRSLEIAVERAGYRVLEVSTPGRLDAIYVKNNIENIFSGEYFVRHLMKHADMETLQEFQRFLQRSNMSSYVQIVAQKLEDRN